jgi:acyl transferase domain-containing protein/acyl carrier protein
LTVFVWEYALAELWRSWGVCLEVMVGEGVGEYVGATLAGVMRVEEALQIVQWWGALSSERPVAGGVSAAFVDRFRNVQLAPPQRPYRSSVTGQWLTTEDATDVAYWAGLLGKPAAWNKALDGVELERQRLLVEVGAGGQLAWLNEGSAQAGLSVLATVSDGRPMQHALAELWVRGVPVDWRRYAAGERRHRVALPTYPFERKRHWIEAPRPAARPTREAQRAPLTDWFYVPSWKRTVLDRRVPVGEAGGAWMVFGRRGGLAEAFAARLERAGQDVLWVEPGDEFRQLDERRYRLRPGCRDDYDRLVAAARRIPQRLVHLWGVSEAEESSETAWEEGFYSLLYLAQALEGHDWTDHGHLELSVISTGLQDVTGREVVKPEKAMVLGPCKVIPQECPGIRCRSVDMELETGDPVQADLIEPLVAELSHPIVDPVVAFRGPHRWVQTFESVQMQAEAFSEGRSRLRPHGVYLITGGLGRFGQVIAEHLARTVRAKLILTARTGLPPREAWDGWLATEDPDHPISRRIQAVRRLEALGAEVLVIGADVADHEQMQAVLAHAASRFGVLHGVVHAAGVNRAEATRALAHSTRDVCEEVFRPKVQGLRVLERLLDGSPLDFFLVTSSLSPILGGLGLIAYAAANLFIDAYVCSRRKIKGATWKTVNWEGWSAPEESSYAQSLGADLKRMFMQDHEIMECFTRVLSIDAPQVVIATGPLQPRIDEWVKLQSLDGPCVARRSHQSQSVASTPAAESRETIERTILDLTSSLLGLEDIGIHDDLFEVGGTSLMAVQLVSRLQDRFRKQVPLRILFERPTVAGLARFISENETRLPSLGTEMSDAPSTVGGSTEYDEPHQ